MYTSTSIPNTVSVQFLARVCPFSKADGATNVPILDNVLADSTGNLSPSPQHSHERVLRRCTRTLILYTECSSKSWIRSRTKERERERQRFVHVNTYNMCTYPYLYREQFYNAMSHGPKNKGLLVHIGGHDCVR